MTSGWGDAHGGRLQNVAILVLEEHQPSGRMMAAVLAASGAIVQTVGTVQDAADSLVAFAPRVLVLDVAFPDDEALAFVRELKSDETTRRIVCVATTVANGRQLERAARDAGCAAYVRKPIDTTTFATLIAKQLEGTT